MTDAVRETICKTAEDYMLMAHLRSLSITICQQDLLRVGTHNGDASEAIVNAKYHRDTMIEAVQSAIAKCHIARLQEAPFHWSQEDAYKAVGQVIYQIVKHMDVPEVGAMRSVFPDIRTLTPQAGVEKITIHARISENRARSFAKGAED